VTLHLRTEDLPALYKAADSASLKAQRQHLALIGADLVALVLGAGLSAVVVSDPKLASTLHSLSAFLLALGFLLSLAILVRRPEHIWYGGRAVAESVKSLSWRYSMCAEPFQRELVARDVDRKLLESLHAVLNQSNELHVPLGDTAGVDPQISKAMRDVRASSLEDRKTVYLEQRVEDQRRWYTSKARSNERRTTVTFLLVMGAQAGALAYAIFLATHPLTNFNATGVLTTLASSILVWTQVKQYQELTQSYGVAAHELGLIAERLRYVTAESEFSVFVADAENAVSREHTLWVARRDRVAPPSRL
jgi:hypothetical protein